MLPICDSALWKLYPKAGASTLAQFVSIAKSGGPYEAPRVIEALPGRPAPPVFAGALRFQQEEHMERSIGCAKNTLNPGRRWGG